MVEPDPYQKRKKRCKFKLVFGTSKMNFLVNKVFVFVCVRVCSHLDIRSWNRSIDTLQEIMLYSSNQAQLRIDVAKNP